VIVTLKEAFERNEAFGANVHDSNTQKRAQCKINYPKMFFDFYHFFTEQFLERTWLFSELFTLVRSCFITQTTFIEGPKSLLTHVHNSRRHKSLENFPTYENSQGKECFLQSFIQNYVDFWFKGSRVRILQKDYFYAKFSEILW